MASRTHCILPSLALGLAAVLAAAPARAGIPNSMHPDFALSEVALPDKYKTMGMAFLPDGRLALAVTDFMGGGEVPGAGNPLHKVLLVGGLPGTPAVQEIANHWLQPAGLAVAEGRLYVSDRDGFYEILQLSPPADLKANRRLVVKWPDEGRWNADGFQWHQYAFTPLWKDGSFYAPYSGSIRKGGPSDVNPTSALSGAFLKWGPSGPLQAFAGGLRSPNGAALDKATGEMVVADNQGSWLPASTFAVMKPGRFYGHSNRSARNTQPNFAEGLPYEPPAAWLPHGTVRSSPGQPLVIESGPYAGDWLLGDCNNPGLVRIVLDRVGDRYNGAVFWFAKGTGNAAINRMATGPDGSLYLGTFSQVGNWPRGDKQPLYRLAPKAQGTAFEMRAIRSVPGGLEIEFTQPVDRATAVKEAFAVKQAQYFRQEGYGGGKQPDQALAVASAAVSPDGRRVTLAIDGLAADRVVHVKHAGLASASGAAPWNDEGWYTLNAVRASAPARAPARPAVAGTLSLRRAAPGRVAVGLAASGPWTAALLSLDGTVLATASGDGPGSCELPAGSARGLLTVRVSLPGGALSRRLVL